MSQELDIFRAAEDGNAEAIRTILQSNHDQVSARDSSGATPLHYAASAGHKSVVELLIRSGADPNACDSNGDVPYDWAMVGAKAVAGNKDPDKFMRILDHQTEIASLIWEYGGKGKCFSNPDVAGLKNRPVVEKRQTPFVLVGLCVVGLVVSIEIWTNAKDHPQSVAGAILIGLGILFYVASVLLTGRFISKNAPAYANDALWEKTAGRGIVPKWTSGVGLIGCATFLVGVAILLGDTVFVIFRAD